MKTLVVIELILIIIWLYFVSTSNTFGGYIHILLGIAILMIISQLISGGDDGGGNDW